MSQESSTASSVTFDDHPVIKETHLPDFQLRAPHLGPTMPVLSPEPNVPEVETEEEVVLGLERTEMESPRLADGEENKEEEEEIQVDQELVRITEFNRYIPYDGPELDPARPLSLRSLPLEDRMHWLVFHQEPTVFQSSDRMVVRNHYGAGTLGQLDPALKPTRSPKAYLVACDFSTESVYAMEWAMGSVLRDGDTLYLVTVIKKGDYGKKRDRLLTETSKRLTKEATDTLADMLLFDISLITYTICGKVKDVLSRLVKTITVLFKPHSTCYSR
ncbi:hypothetical protein BY458DRAFT_563505 [Sporodiniella umbellata]|nr:hypothetical protein BY458DRAFT_563505 [Sporodiniella umbellata]